jgi:hypothetical protein
MTFAFSVSNATATGAAFLFGLKTHLKANGWTVMSSSDGTTYNSGGDQITTAAAGAGGMSNTSAWFRIRSSTMGGFTRELTFQVSAAGAASWRVKYSTSGGFTGGSPGITQTPSATDEKILKGSGTDASPGYAVSCVNSAANAQYCAGDSAEGYSFYALQTTAGVVNSFNFMDYTDNIPSEDTDPAVLAFGSTTATTYTSLYNPGAAVASTWFGRSSISPLFTNVSIAVPVNSNTNIPAKSMGPNPYTTNSNIISLYWMRSITDGGTGFSYKGRSRLHQFSLNIQANGSTYNTKSKIQIGDFVYPWDSTTVPVI